jgi:hypothetical protein
MIRRIVIAETVGGDGRSAAWAQRRLEGLVLRRENDGTEVAALAPVVGRTFLSAFNDAVFRAYLEPADCWQTVTPVILPGGWAQRGADIPVCLWNLVKRCIEQAGIPLEAVADLEVQGGGGHSCLPSRGRASLRNCRSVLCVYISSGRSPGRWRWGRAAIADWEL